MFRRTITGGDGAPSRVTLLLALSDVPYNLESHVNHH